MANLNDGSLHRTSPALPFSCLPSTSTDWWKKVSRDPLFGRLHLNRRLLFTCLYGVQCITIRWLGLKFKGYDN